MCGICGVIGRHEQPGHSDAVASMMQSLARRGPDDAGSEVWAGAVLGHRRLSIFDLSPAGHQPMSLEGRRVSVVFNGAIYNFRELRAELEARGAKFRSETDTEVLLHGYEAWGIRGLVERVRGMFAFALWIPAEETLFLVRDRLGVKPLVFAQRDGQLAFASTVRALRDAGWVSDLDEQAVAEYLELGFVSESRSIYAGATKVKPATVVEWSRRGLKSWRYWEAPSPAQTSGLTFDDAVRETERLLLKATEDRLQADVPVGALLSGGVDSALVCWAIRELGADVTAYTVGTPGHPEDETADAVETARELRIRHKVLPLEWIGREGSADTDIGDIVAAYAEPFACASSIGMLRISEVIAGSGIKVLLTGDGGDDLFLGYERHRLLWRTQAVARALPRWSEPMWRVVRGAVPLKGPFRRAVHLVDYTVGGVGAFLAAHDGLAEFRARGLLGARLRDVALPDRAIPWSVASGRRALLDYLVHDLQNQFVSEYLTKVDGATMYHALEARSPFFDQSLWEFAGAVPVGVRLHGGELKAILRELARRRIGARVASGPKRGFRIPVERWLASDASRASLRARFHNSVLVKEGWVDGAALAAATERARAKGLGSHHLWYLSVLEEWMRAERGAPRSATTRAA